jgi:4-amino-4-deoxy-L-arabinose transferase-like glycosyltransferase
VIRVRTGPWLATGLLVFAAAAVFTRALSTRTNYDEGVYLASLDALRRGQELGSEIYTSQPPAFYWILRVVAAPFGSSVEGIRVGFVLLALLGVAAAVALGWRLFVPSAGIAAGAFLAIGPPYPTVAPTVAADVPAVALGLVSLAMTAFGLRSDAAARRWGILAGATFALAAATKLLAIPFAAPLAALALSSRTGRRLLPWTAVGAVGVAVVLLVAHAGSLDAIWAGVVGDHTRAAELGSHSRNVSWIARHLEPRTPIAWLVFAGVVSFALSRRARATWPLWTLVPAAALFLVFVRPLADHHLLLLSVAWAISAGPSLALAIGGLPGRPYRLAAAGAAVVLVAAGLYQEQRRLHRNDTAEPAEIVWAVDVVRDVTAPNATIVSDQPIVGFLARRAQPGALVDTSNTRVAGGGLSADEVVAEIESAEPDAVVTGRMLRTLPSVLARLEALYPTRVRCGGTTVYVPADSPAVRSCPS